MSTDRTTHIIKKVYQAQMEKQKKKRGFVNFFMPKPHTVKLTTRQKPETPRSTFVRYARSAILWGGVALFLFHFVLIYYYNVFQRNYYDVIAAESIVDNMLQKRHNISINLAKMVLDYSQHEQKIMSHVVNSRTKIAGSGAMQEIKEQLAKVASENGAAAGGVALSPDLMSKLFAIAEQYPDLKLSQNFQKFIDALVETEKEISASRTNFNKLVNKYTTELVTFPGNICNMFFRFEPKDFFTASKDAKRFKAVAF